MADNINSMDPDYWLKTLSITSAPVTRAGVQAFLAFCSTHMPELSVDDRLSFLRGIDLHSPVTPQELPTGTLLAAFRYNTPNPFRLFYTKAGTSVRNLGVNPDGRRFKRFQVVHQTPALASRCAAARETWTNEADPRDVFDGGGIQYIIPKSEHVLRLV